VDPEFQRALIIVLVGGTLVMGIGTVTLIFVFRQFGEKKAGSSSHFALIFALIAFIFAICGGLLLLSYRG
jgi:hypothetical protein